MPSLEQAIPFLAFGLIALGIWLNFNRIRHSLKAKSLVISYISSQGFTIHSVRRAKFSAGPFPASGAMGEPIFRIAARDKEGNKLSGWACCPLPPKPIEIKWAE